LKIFGFIRIKYSSSSDDELSVASKLYLISSSGRRYSAHPINERIPPFIPGSEDRPTEVPQLHKNVKGDISVLANWH
jgi:hypothetical protein